MKRLLTTSSIQVLENLTGIALGNGFTLPQDCSRKDWATKNLKPNLDQDEYMTNFLQSLLEIEKIRDYFVTQLRRTLKPQLYGIDRVWKKTQSEAIEAVIYALENWYTRPLVEIPTGVGKSMIWGAFARAFYDTLRMFGVEDMFEIVIFTSRIHIGEQMITRTKNTSIDVEDDDAPLELGDVKMWLPQLTSSDIRILSGKTNSQKEKMKNAKVTIACYQGLNEQTLYSVFEKKSGLILLDESHRVTDRIRIMLENKMHTGFFIGGSGTTKGPRRNNPFIFFEAMKPEKENGIDVPYNERLAYYAPISRCVLRHELKRLRYVNTKTSIDLSSIDSSTGDIPQQQAAKLIAKNVPAMKHILEELFLGEQEVLRVAGSKLPIARKWLVFVDRVAIAEELAQFCNEELLPQIQKKYGANTPFTASYVSGPQSKTRIGMNHKVFTERMVKFHNGDITVLFSSEKLGEGSDVPNVNGILSFRAYGRPSVWKFIQEVGRGTRYFENDDLLIVDGVFKSSRHRLASLTSEFGIASHLSGGLIAGYQGEREAETKVFALLQQGFSWKEVWNELSDDEKVLVPFVQKFLTESVSTGPEVQDFYREIDIKSIEFVETNGLTKLELVMQKGNVLELAKEQLLLNGISNYWDLVYKKHIAEFIKIDFGIFISPIYFCRCLDVPLARKITQDTIEKIAEKFKWTPSQEDKINKYKEILLRYGIYDYWSLISYGSGRFIRTDFKPFGGAKIFLGAILGEVSVVSNHSLLKVADKLGWNIPEEEKRQKYRHEFAKHGIIDYWSLTINSFGRYKKNNFGSFGKIHNFVTCFILEGRKISYFKKDILIEVAEKLGWQLTKEEKIERYKQELAKHGIVDYKTILMCNCKTFRKLDFGIFGKGSSFYGYIANEQFKGVTSLKKLSAICGFKPIQESKINLVKEELLKYGITDYWTLIYKYPNEKFRTLRFGSLGKATRLVSSIFEFPIFNVTHTIMIQVAEKLGWQLTKEEKIERYKQELAKHGIRNHWDILACGKNKFLRLDFGMFGKGLNFLSIVLSESKNIKTFSSLLELSEKMNWIPSEEEKKERYKQELAKQGITTQAHLELFGVSKFRAADFGVFGKGAAFISIVFEKTRYGVQANREVILDFGKKIGLE